MKPSDSWRTREEQDELIDAFEESNLTLKEFAASKGVRPNYISYLRYWRRKREAIAQSKLDREYAVDPLPVLTKPRKTK